MNKSLSQEACQSCQSNSPSVPSDELPELMKQLPEWKIRVEEGVARLHRKFQFKDFQQALDFANRVGDLAESVNHHPALLVEWGQVTVTWWTHAIGGLHRNDFIMAAKTDRL